MATNLKKAQSVEEASDIADGAGSLDEDVANVLVHDQVKVAVSVSAFEVLETELGGRLAARCGGGNDLFGSWQLVQVRCKQDHFTGSNRELSLLGAHGEALDADDVTSVEVVVDALKVLGVV